MRLEHCAVPICRAMLKVLDFSADNDHEPDSNGEYTSATIEAGPLPESFTICSAFMVDGQLLGEGEYKRDEDEYRPANLRLGLGFVPLGSFAAKENTGRVSELNIFNSSLSAERMKGLTTSGGEECGAPGDLVSWEEAEWTLHSQAKEVEVDREWEGPCRRESKVQVFTADFFRQDFCMHLCQKISGGRSPPVTTREEWESLTREVDLITRDRSTLPFMWISATEGYFPGNLGFDNTWLWPDTEVVNNKTKKLESVETIWRDFYTGQRLGKWTKPYYFSENDTMFGTTHNCIHAYTDVLWDKSWFEYECLEPSGRSCPCSYPAQPILRLRGLCKSSPLDRYFSPKQLPDNPGNMILMGLYSAKIEFNDASSQWVLTDARYNVTAMSRATKLSYLLGKHYWTISYVKLECSGGKPQTIYLKLTG